jgi:phenylalanyl-tRNA synthetase alpha chain
LIDVLLLCLHVSQRSGSWKDVAFKPLNLNAKGLEPERGRLHPLLKVRTLYRSIFLEMGFQEMATNNYVESSFWNFDALFQPQQHPSRDAHDTFFLREPASTVTMPMDYLERVKSAHESGCDGSIG